MMEQCVKGTRIKSADDIIQWIQHPLPTIVEPSGWDTSVPPATAALPELPSSNELPSLSPQMPDSTEHSHPQAPVVEEAPTTRRYPARVRRPPDCLAYDS